MTLTNTWAHGSQLPSQLRRRCERKHTTPLTLKSTFTFFDIERMGLRFSLQILVFCVVVHFQIAEAPSQHLDVLIAEFHALKSKRGMESTALEEGEDVV